MSTCRFHVHPYFCFRPSENALYGSTCDYDTPTVAAVAAVVVPAVAVVAALTSIPTVAAISAIAVAQASTLAQYDLPGHFQPKIGNMNLNIYNAISKPKVFFKNSPQQHIIE